MNRIQARLWLIGTSVRTRSQSAFAVGWLLLATLPASAQVIFPGLTGDPLVDSLRSAYLPATVEMFVNAEDLIFDVVYRTNNGGTDGVFGVYTGFFVPFDGLPTADPSWDVLNYPNHDSLGLNVEHTWPQSKGAGSGNAQSNMHHLFPSKRNVNFARGELPFGEVDDQLADIWYQHGTSSTTIPADSIDEYAELQQGVQFEPREDHKGNVARAMFYFYAMYRARADSADASFFGLQKNTLRTWHLIDPADSAETARNAVVASYQDGKINPFIQDGTLVDRAFFETELAVDLTSFDVLADGSSIIARWTVAASRQPLDYLVKAIDSDGIVVDQAVVTSGTKHGGTVHYSHKFNASGAARVHLYSLTTGGESLELGVRAVYPDPLDLPTVFPNPAATVVTVRIPETAQASWLSIYDISGRLVLATYLHDGEVGNREARIDASALPKGTYFIRFSGNRAYQAKSFVIIR